ncbi:MAG: radical SAM protein [Candidatus Eisenbacteria bacterium]|nr:radical SAM protein [Candidatus Eisenbacteria bacterium]
MPSRYNIIISGTASTPTLILNTYTSALIALDDETDEETVRSILARPLTRETDTPASAKTIATLSRNGFLVESERDERAEINLRGELGRYRSRQVMLTILPTLRCNFSCDYCFEAHPDENMTPEVEDGIVRYVQSVRRDYDSLFVTWFGGEPLLRLSVIRSLAPKLQAVFSHYSSTIITNGFLMRRQASRHLLDAGVSSAQITMDGPELFHEARRPHVDGVPTYARILENIHDACELDLAVSVRVNMDRKMAKAPESMARLIADVYDASGGRAVPYFSPVFGYENAPDFSTGNRTKSLCMIPQHHLGSPAVRAACSTAC